MKRSTFFGLDLRPSQSIRRVSQRRNALWYFPHNACSFYYSYVMVARSKLRRKCVFLNVSFIVTSCCAIAHRFQCMYLCSWRQGGNYENKTGMDVSRHLHVGVHSTFTCCIDERTLLS